MTFSLIICFSCKRNSNENNRLPLNVDSEVVSLLEKKKESEEILKNQKNEDFKGFSSKFIADSTFRYNRIRFPVKSINSDYENGKTYFSNKIDFNFYFSDTVEKINNGLIEKTIFDNEEGLMVLRLYIPNSGYDTKWYFKLDNYKWYLDNYYYSNQ